ncbi:MULTISPECIES: hypothetical protein [Pseudoalteromonas]|nr:MULTISPECIES: hypothetical protein [Pseudoalteromonas]QLJ09256.1 hypothetical protein GZH31_05260 [Pseudoalteromonas sp. JSTW]QMW15485.1 hypothetical protein H3302_05150 [Pseudoalteromonas sp. MT33b]|tara:strand:+ start:1839 stop:2012 length:174 start_codon:yes stop_codon:yes gene_type:complete
MAPFLSFKNTNGLHLSAGKVHQLSNQGSEALHFIVTSTPPVTVIESKCRSDEACAVT